MGFHFIVKWVLNMAYVKIPIRHLKYLVSEYEGFLSVNLLMDLEPLQ